MAPRRSPGEQGQSLVEMALISLILIYLVMGAVDFGRTMFSQVVLTQAAKDGARKGAAYPNCRSTVSNFASVTTGSQNTTYNSIDYAVAQAGQRLNLGTSNITVTTYSYDPATGTRTAASAAAGGQIDVAVSYSYTPITPVMQSLIGSPTLTATATHLIEAAPSGC
ncbi:MAG: pilus assembly protein [Chloroflexi bacterium]|nr:pilus assembly protein [Chloroflexota bacterium]